jgi:hypothetical protein
MPTRSELAYLYSAMNSAPREISKIRTNAQINSGEAAVVHTPLPVRYAR